MSKFLDRMRGMVVDTGVTTVMGTRCTYDVVAKDFEPHLPNFVGQIDWQQGQYFISEDTPIEYRPLVIFHEHRCFLHKAAGQIGHCKHALQEELALAAERDVNIDAYIGFRFGFLEAVLKYYEGREVDPKLINEITASREHLRTLII